MTRQIDVNTMPERTVIEALQTGIAAILADTSILDTILSTVDADELVKVKAFFADHPPAITLGYPRHGASLPLYAVTLGSDNVQADYIGIGEEAALDADNAVTGNLFGRRLTASFVVYIYADHPDVCAWYYRVARRILGVATRWFIDRGLTEPTLSGAELAPDPRYIPENVFVRRLTLTVEYEEGWDDTDTLFAAFYTAEDRLTADGEVDITHEDAAGGVQPLVDDEEWP